jgi:hypothetical protein
MGIIKENVLMLCCSLNYFKGRTSKQLQTEVDWLKNLSLYGIEFYLVQGENMGYIYSKINKDNDIIYYTKKKGLKAYYKEFGE